MKMASIAVLGLLLVPLGGCASLAENALRLPSGILTQSVTNPVTPAMLYEVENGASVAFAALNTYRTNCRDQILADNQRRAAGEQVPPRTCKKVVTKLQVYTSKIPPLLAQLRKFVRTNDQVNAQVVFGQVRELISTVRSFALTSGV